jgi:hypothetical protein
MVPDTLLATVRCWFGDVRCAALELPDGWFGPPQETRHKLSWSELTEDRLVVELDRVLVLEFGEVETVAVVDDLLLIQDFAELTFTCHGFRGVRPQRRSYESGAVRLRPPLGKRAPIRQTGRVAVLQ